MFGICQAKTFLLKVTIDVSLTSIIMVDMGTVCLYSRLCFLFSTSFKLVTNRNILFYIILLHSVHTIEFLENIL